MNKSLLWSMAGARLAGLWIALLFAALSTLALVRDAKREELSLTSGLFMGIEPGSGRSRSVNYAIVETDDGSRRFSIRACEPQIARLPKGTAVSVLHDAGTLFEIRANDEVPCAYAATVQALVQARRDNLRLTLSIAAGGALLALLAIWSRWKTRRHLIQLRAVMQRREAGGSDR